MTVTENRLFPYTTFAASSFCWNKTIFVCRTKLIFIYNLHERHS